MINRKSFDMKNITSGQVRAARALLKLNAQELADMASLGVATVRRAELAEGKLGMTDANELAVRRALEQAGIIFIESNGEGPGVRLRK